MMMGKHTCSLCKISGILLVIGGLNWGLVGILEWNLVEELLGGWPMVVRIVYALVGISALAAIGHWCGMCGACKKLAGDCKDGKCEMHGGMAPKGPAMEGKM
jgi:uncharacterized membrane protein YuzA (DUF378 family)